MGHFFAPPLYFITRQSQLQNWLRLTRLVEYLLNIIYLFIFKDVIKVIRDEVTSFLSYSSYTSFPKGKCHKHVWGVPIIILNSDCSTGSP